MFLDAIDHVQLAMPPGGEDVATSFYEGVLGIPRVPKPPELAARGGCWFERGIVRVHLGVQDDFVPATKAHPAFAVVDLDLLTAQLEAAGWPYRPVEGPDGPQVYVDDPFGNRIELRPGRPIAPLPETAEAIIETARAVGGDRLAGQLAFVAELDRLKAVERRSHVVGGLRRENTAEHSWHVAVLARVLADAAEAELDVDAVVRMLLVHDIVEIDADDTFIYDDAGRETKAAREQAAADRLFGLLPHDLATSFRADWDAYEDNTSPEAAFAHSFDRLAPLLLNITAGGATWSRGQVAADDVRRVCAPIADGSALLGRLRDALIDEAVATGMLPERRGPADDPVPPVR